MFLCQKSERKQKYFSVSLETIITVKLKQFDNHWKEVTRLLVEQHLAD
jgi:hypothetical protein